MARPSEFTPEIATDICERIADGESLRKICAEEGFPSRPTVRLWLSQQPAFLAQYAHAREEQADVYAERIVDEAATATDAGLGRLKMDALKWAASKLAPKRYGDKVTQEHVGADGGAIQTKVLVEFVPPKPDPVS